MKVDTRIYDFLLVTSIDNTWLSSYIVEAPKYLNVIFYTRFPLFLEKFAKFFVKTHKKIKYDKNIEILPYGLT